tara:strand:+ start:4087 stop:5040 length:954 start_codon:yes stop_codon:yes gene_type:complete
MTKIAVVGVGTFGQQHARVLASLPEVELVAVVDKNPERSAEIAKRFQCEGLNEISSLIGKIDAASVAVPTALHREIGVDLLKAGIDILVEKPIAPDLISADALVQAAEDNGRILQVGHLERFNPIVEAAQQVATLPLFFEVHRMSPFSPRSLDVDVVLDLMIHDLDILLSLVKSKLERLEATGIAILSVKPDIASVRLVFKNGCVANLSASRVSVEKIRKLRFFQPRQYISLDYTRRDGVIYEVSESNKISHHPLTTSPSEEPLVRQLKNFLACVKNRTKPRVSGVDARNALSLALTIVEAMETHSGIVAETLNTQK